MECKICGKPVKLDYMEDVNETLKRLEICFDCNFWLEIVSEFQTKETIEGLINIWIKPDYSVYYALETDLNQISGFRGYGGRTFIATLLDGSTQESSNVWNRGIVPEGLRTLMEPNVEKVETDWQRRQISIADSLCKKCGFMIVDESVGCTRCKTKHMKDVNEKLEKLTVQRVKELAMQNYNSGGDAIVECWDDKDIQDWIDRGNTLKDLEIQFNIREGSIQDIENTRW